MTYPNTRSRSLNNKKSRRVARRRVTHKRVTHKIINLESYTDMMMKVLDTLKNLKR